MFKMLKVIDFVTLIIAVTALIISIVCMNKKCDNFGDTVCGVPGKVGEGEYCISNSAMCARPGSEGLYCGEKLTCGDDGKCKSGESIEMCTGRNKQYCRGSGPTPGPPSSDCPRIKFLCNIPDCPDCDEFPDCDVKYIDFLKENNRIRINNGQNKLIVYIIFLLRVMRNFKRLFK